MAEIDDRELGERVLAFIELHSRNAAAYEEGVDDPEERFNGPDSAMLHAAGTALTRGLPPQRVHSDWGSGCYRPMGDASLKAEHDELVRLVNARADAGGGRRAPF